MHVCIVKHHHTTWCAKSQDKRHALQAATRRCKVSYVLSFSSMFEPLRLSRASGSFSHLRASAGLQSSSTSVAVPTPPTILCLPCQSRNPVLATVLNKNDPHCNETEFVSDLMCNNSLGCNSKSKCLIAVQGAMLVVTSYTWHGLGDAIGIALWS